MHAAAAAAAKSTKKINLKKLLDNLSWLSVEDVEKVQRSQDCKSVKEARELCDFLVEWKKQQANLDELPFLDPEMLRLLDTKHLLKLKEGGLVPKKGIRVWVKWWDDNDVTDDDSDDYLSAARRAAQSLMMLNDDGCDDGDYLSAARRAAQSLMMLNDDGCDDCDDDKEAAHEFCIENYDPFTGAETLFRAIEEEVKRFYRDDEARCDEWMRRAFDMLHVPEHAPCGAFGVHSIWETGKPMKWLIGEGIGSNGCFVYASFLKDKNKAATKKRRIA
jgi:hypothetical protein